MLKLLFLLRGANNFRKLHIVSLALILCCIIACRNVKKIETLSALNATIVEQCNAETNSLLSRGRNFCQITQKGQINISLGRGILVAVRPQVWLKVAEKRLENIF